jgi:hypothetical protein
MNASDFSQAISCGNDAISRLAQERVRQGYAYAKTGYSEGGWRLPKRSKTSERCLVNPCTGSNQEAKGAAVADVKAAECAGAFYPVAVVDIGVLLVVVH